MDVKVSIYTRRAIRHYQDKQLDRQTIEALLDAAVHAPSAINEQPWAFLVIEDKDLLKRISDRSKELMKGSPAWPKMDAGFRSMIEDPAFNVFYNAPALIVICRKQAGEHPDWDCCFAAMNLMLRAKEMGLGTCVIGFSWEALRDPAIKSALKIPNNYEAILPIIVGVPAEAPAPTSRRAPEILSWLAPVAAHR